jgi:uncharacterized protein YqgC (DUF456 family)
MEEIGTIIGISLLALCCVLAVAMTALRLPGTWLIIAGALVYGWWADWEGVPWWLVVLLLVVAVVAEVVEWLSSAVTTRKAGGSRQAAIGALVGGFAGMLFLSFLVPIPLVGTMLGALVGCFGGALIAELAMRKKLTQGAKVGLFSALGYVLGTVTKMAIAFTMAGILLTSVVCSPPQRIADPDASQPGAVARDAPTEEPRETPPGTAVEEPETEAAPDAVEQPEATASEPVVEDPEDP